MAAGDWKPGKWAPGDRVVWYGVRLVCCVGHKTRDAALHPWDLSADQAIMEASLLWTPDGEVECARMKRLGIDMREQWPARLRTLALVAAGVAKVA